MSSKYLGFLALAAVSVVAACGAPVGTEPADSKIVLGKTSGGTTTLTNPLAVCPTTPYDSVTVAVGTQGGTIQVGKHSLVIPARALSQTVTISMVNPGDNTASVRFHPGGLQFNWLALPVLTLNYKGCSTSAAPKIVYIDDTSYILEWLSTLFLDPKNSQIQSYIQHFSRYAVAW